MLTQMRDEQKQMRAEMGQMQTEMGQMQTTLTQKLVCIEKHVSQLCPQYTRPDAGIYCSFNASLRLYSSMTAKQAGASYRDLSARL